MNPLKSSLRRATAVMAGALIGVAGAAVFAAPASAHHPIIDGSDACVLPGGDSWKVSWQVSNSEIDLAGDVTEVIARPLGTTNSFSGIAVGDTLPKLGDGDLTGEQILSWDAPVAFLTVEGHWVRDGWDVLKKETGSRIRPLKIKKCAPVTPSPTPTTTAPDPTPTTTAPDPTTPTTEPEPTPTTTAPEPTPTTTAPEEPTPTTTEPEPTPTTTAPEPTPTTTEPEPTPTTTAPDPTPSVTTPEPDPTGTFPTPPATPTATPPGSATPTPPPTEGGPSPVTEPEFVYDETCDTITVGIDNPADFEELTVTFDPSVGESKTVVAPPGQVTVVDFPASVGLTITATPEGYEDEAATIEYRTPADCAGGDGGGLPLTGAAASSIAGGAVLLLGIGAVLFVVSRRRKVKFTA